MLTEGGSESVSTESIDCQLLGWRQRVCLGWGKVAMGGGEGDMGEDRH